jgi:hypothetical protein
MNTTEEEQSLSESEEEKNNSDFFGLRKTDPDVTLKRKREEEMTRETFLKKAKTDDTYEANKLRAKIKQLKALYPKVDISKSSELDEQLRHMDVEELKAAIENIHGQTGLGHTFSSAKSLVKLSGHFLETKLNCPGYSNALSKEQELVIAIDDLLPSSLSNLRGIPEILWAYWNAYKNPIIEEPETNIAEKKEKKKKKKKDGDDRASSEIANCREIKNGKNDICSEVNKEMSA